MCRDQFGINAPEFPAFPMIPEEQVIFDILNNGRDESPPPEIPEYNKWKA
jgi:hypothetical protein